MSSLSHQDSLVPLSSAEAKKLSCPVCLTVLGFPIYQCENGHLICNKCVNRLQTCPICRVVLPVKKIRSLVAEDSVAKLPFKCRNSNKGCKGVFVASELSGHMQNCEYRLVRVCQYLGFGCLKDLMVKDITNHLKTLHKLPTINIQDGQYAEMRLSGMQVEQVGRMEWPPVMLLSENQPPLVLQIGTSVNNLYLAISAVHSHRKVKNFKAKIKIVTDPQGMYSVTWKGAVDKLRNEFSHPETFSVPTSKIKGLEYWKLLVKISSETNTEAGRAIPQLSTQARPVPVVSRVDHVSESTGMILAEPLIQLVNISSSSDSE